MYTRLQRQRTEPFLILITGTIVALFVGAPGLFVAYMIATRQPGYDFAHLEGPDPHRFVMAAGAFSMVAAVLMILSWIDEALAAQSPETVLEIDPAQLRPGGTVRMRIVQPGPIHIRSIRVTLFGERRVRLKVINDQRIWIPQRHGPHQMTEIDRQELGAGEALEREAPFTVPANVESSTWVNWRIEVCSKVAWRRDLVRQFPVTVEPHVDDEAAKL